MNIEQKMEWLRPERIQKLYDGQKSPFGMNRLFVIGIGKNGVDCVLRCMHLTEKRFGKDPKKVRFLCIGEETQLGERSYEGSAPGDGFTLPIDPEEAIYKYLNNPAKLPESAQIWFDSGLKNYSPAAPTYGLTKRQCGRIALFHYLKQIMKLTGEAAVRAQGIVLASGETAQDYGDITLAAGGAILGVTLGSLISVVYLHHKFRQSNQILSLGGGTAKSTRSTMKELLSIAVPITLGSAGLQIINLFDTMIYMRRLTGALQWTEKMADSAKGVYNFCQTVFALPCSFIPTITIAVIPAITASLTRKDLAEAKATSESSVRTMALIAMPCAAGLFVMAEPVIRLLCSTYTEDRIQLAATMLAILGLTVIFNSLVLLLNAIMQAHGDVVTPVVNMLIGGIIKIIVNYILVGQPNLNIVGAPIGTFICYISITALDLIAMKRHISARPAIFKNIIRPGLASAIMGAATFMVYRVLSNAISSWKLACLLSLAFAVVLYAVLVVFLRCLTYEDCMLLPKGEKIAKILRIRKKN